MKTDFQVLKLTFYACNFEQAFCPLHKLLLRDLNNTNILSIKLIKQQSIKFLGVKIWNEIPVNIR